MSKNKRIVHLICNAHLDPIWQWKWNEGISAAVSTFRSAAELCDEYDYVFCHGEAMLYEAIEEYAPDLFVKIQELVKSGKWHIMGGWYLQPDCNMPQGESFIRQIKAGTEYFEKKFGVKPTTAINFDPFGHTRGLVQIMNKCGQDSYIVMRPKKHEITLPAEQFLWEGFDGSTVKVFRTECYNSPLGEVVDVIVPRVNNQVEKICAVTWGVGNHGGGPSRKDLRDIANLKVDGMEFIHSTPERFFSEINPTAKFSESLRPSMPGCYVSMSRLKHLHAVIENQLYFTEIISSVAEMNGHKLNCDFELKEAEKALLTSEFHDVLPGTSIKAGEDNGLQKLYYARELLERVCNRAFFALTSDFEPAKEGEYPVFVFNPHPYELESDIDCEFSLADQNWSGKYSYIEVYHKGEKLTSQDAIEDSVLNLDWRKKVVFTAKLAPLSVERFDVKVKMIENEHVFKPCGISEDLVFEDCGRTVRISKETGNIVSYVVNGKEYINEQAFVPFLYDDNADPWAMDPSQLHGIGTNGKEIRLTKSTDGVFKNIDSIRIIENGDVFTKIECFYVDKNVKLRKTYKVYHNKIDVDVNFNVFYNDADSILKIEIPVTACDKYLGQTAFGREENKMDGSECVSLRYVAIKSGEDNLAIFNDGVYGHSFKDGKVRLSLIRGAGYCVHPINDRPLIPHDRYVNRMDQCEHEYAFKLTVLDEKNLDRVAIEFNRKPYALNLFPRGKGVNERVVPVLSNKNITLHAFAKTNDGKYFLRLFNGYESAQETTVSIGKLSNIFKFGKYEIKTIIFDENSFEEVSNFLI